MRLHEVVAAAVRLFAFYLVFVCITLVVNLVPVRLTASGYELDRIHSYWALSSLLSLVFCGALILFLLLRTDTVVSWVLRASPKTEGTGFSADDLTLVAVMVAGLVFFVDGAQGLLHDAATWVFAAKDTYTGSRPLLPFQPAAVVANAFKTLFGLWLVLGHRSLVNFTKRFRGLTDLPKAGGQGRPDA